MDAALLDAASTAWASLSAIAVLLLGLVALAVRRARPPGSIAFGAFAVVWGLQILASRWMAYADAASIERAHLAYLALLLPLPYLLVQFTRGFVAGGAERAGWRTLTVASVAMSLAAIGLLFLAPETLYEGALRTGSGFAPAWGPLFAPLVMLPFFLAFGLALWALDAERRRSATLRTAERHAFLAAGLGVFLAFSAGNNLTYYAIDGFLYQALPLASFYLALFLVLAVLSLWLGVRATVDALQAPSARMRRPALLVALATLVPLAWGAAEGLLAYSTLQRLNTVGLWRLGGVAMLAFALARWRMPGLAPRSRQTAATALGIATAAATGALALGLALLLAPGTPAVALAGLVLPIATLSPSLQLARRALHVESALDLSADTLPARLETYRAALEASLARRSVAHDEPFLAGLRERLGISPDVHDALLCIARDTVLPRPDAAHPGYERLRLLGEGAHGRAWLARRRVDDELVVLKEPFEHDEAARATLVRQARLAQRVRHPHLVAIHHVADAAQGSFLVMDHMPGGSLADRLARGPLPPAQAIGHTCEVLEGLEALHRARLTHGDVKAANVLLDAKGHARLADFGLTRASEPDATRTMAPVGGTLAAMAPEQLDGVGPTPSTDLYATGALLYRLLTGEHYVRFGGLDETRARELVRAGEPHLPHPLVPSAIEPVLRRALAKRPEDRYPSARAMRDDLLAAASRL